MHGFVMHACWNFLFLSMVCFLQTSTSPHYRSHCEASQFHHESQDLLQLWSPEVQAYARAFHSSWYAAYALYSLQTSNSLSLHPGASSQTSQHRRGRKLKSGLWWLQSTLGIFSSMARCKVFCEAQMLGNLIVTHLLLQRWPTLPLLPLLRVLPFDLNFPRLEVQNAHTVCEWNGMEQSAHIGELVSHETQVRACPHFVDCLQSFIDHVANCWHYLSSRLFHCHQPLPKTQPTLTNQPPCLSWLVRPSACSRVATYWLPFPPATFLVSSPHQCQGIRPLGFGADKELQTSPMCATAYGGVHKW